MGAGMYLKNNVKWYKEHLKIINAKKANKNNTDSTTNIKKNNLNYKLIFWK